MAAADALSHLTVVSRLVCASGRGDSGRIPDVSDYAVVNLLEIADSMAGRTEGIEGRFARGHLGSRDLGVSHWRYAPGRRLFSHRRREQEEAYIVLAGSGRMRLDEEVRDVGP